LYFQKVVTFIFFLLAVTTRTNQDSVAITYTMDNNGNVIDQRPSPNSQGTVVTCTALFWNVPVRKQFSQTKQKKTEELMKVEHLLLKYGLVHPELHISLNHDGNMVWQKNRATDLKSNILQTLGHAITSNMEFVIEKERVRNTFQLNCIALTFQLSLTAINWFEYYI